MNVDVPKLLVSVCSVLEAEAAMAGGADVIDVKEPSRGALGRADDDVLNAIGDAVGGRLPISAALGEFADFSGAVPAGFDFVKCGLAGLAGDGEWHLRWVQLRDAVSATAVVVAYADWQCCQAPSLDDVIAFACRQPNGIVLIDTGCKDKNLHGRRATLLDWTPLPDLETIVKKVHRASGRIALAGSLGLEEIAQLRELKPDWIAVRGAACADADRAAMIDSRRVRNIKSLLSGRSES